MSTTPTSATPYLTGGKSNKKQNVFHVSTVHIAGSHCLVPRPRPSRGLGTRQLEAIVTEVGTVQALIQ